VKFHTVAFESDLPSRSFAPTVIVAVYVELGSKYSFGENDAEVPLKLTDPDKETDPFLS